MDANDEKPEFQNVPAFIDASEVSEAEWIRTHSRSPPTMRCSEKSFL